MKSLPPLYSRTSNGAVQVWSIVVDGDGFYTVEGLKGGKFTESKPTKCKPKNVGKANATTASEQAEVEAKAKWDKKIASGYFESEKDIDQVKFFEPMLAKKFGEVEFSYPVWTQPKLDGMRCIVKADGMWSRNGKKVVSAPHIFKALKPLFDKFPDLIFDGELFTDKLKNDFNKIMSLAKRTKPTQDELDESERLLQYHIYDFPSCKKNFTGRFNDLLNLFINDGKPDCIKIVHTQVVGNKEELDAEYAKFLEDGQEGQIIRTDSPYENKRSKYLLKRKEFLDEEFEILDIEEGKGTRSGMFGRAILKTKKGIEFEANARGTHEYYAELLKNKKDIIGKMATVRYQNLTPDGKPRFGVMVAIRDYE